MNVNNYSVSGEGLVSATSTKAKINSSKIEKVSPLNFVGDGQYVILINSEGRYDLLGGQGIIAYNDLDTAIEARKAFSRETGEVAIAQLKIGIYLVQKSMNEYGVITNELVEYVK